MGAKWERIWCLLSCPPGINGYMSVGIEIPENSVHSICTLTLEIAVIISNLRTIGTIVF